MDHKLFIKCILLNILLLFANGLITQDGEFEDRKNYIKFKDPHDNLDISTYLDENHSKPVKFTDDITKNNKENISKDPDTKLKENIFENDNNLVVFEENKEQQVNESGNFVKKPRRQRRKRRPRQQSFNGSVGLVSQGIPEGQSYVGAERPKRRRRLPRKPSLMEQTSSTFINALTSISLYDDQQCIPKLLCDTTAGRKGGVTAGSMLQGFLDLQPLMTLLLAYNSGTASPLFSFGRAIIIGMSSSHHNPYICQKSYPLCPSDPEKLVHYLNNHNGGFFRFFNNPNNHQQQSLNQFLGHLSNPLPPPPGVDQNLYEPQKLGLDQLNKLGYPTNHLLNNQQYLRPLNPYQNQNPYGSLQSQNHFNNYKNVGSNFGKELNEKDSKVQSEDKSRVNNNELIKYGEAHDKTIIKNNDIIRNNNLDHSIKINRRILTKSVEDEEKEIDDNNELIEAFEDIPKWLLPDDDKRIQIQTNSNNRKMKTLFFPDEIDITNNDNLNIHQPTAEYRPPLNNNDDNNKKGFVFPDFNRYNHIQDINRFKINRYNKKDNKLNVKYESINLNNLKDDDYETVYVVRGNGDPYHPEIVKIRSGTK